MARAWLPRAVFACFTAGGLASCTLLTGVGDLGVDSSSDAAFDVVADRSAADTGSGLVDTGFVEVTDADVPETGILDPVDARTVDACSPTGCVPIPVGFQLVAFGAQGAACPSGFTAPSDVVSDVGIGAGACSCGSCVLTAAPSCAAPATVTNSFGPTAAEGGVSCAGSTGPSYTGNACATDGYNGPFGPSFDNQYGVPPSPGVGGSCSTNVVKDASKLQAANRRICKASVIPSCNSQVCLPTLPVEFNACVAAAGDVPCSADFPTKHLTGTSASFTCSPTCGCNIFGGKCVTGKLNFYASADCSGPVGYAAAANGQCKPTPNAGGPFGSHDFTPDPPFGAGCSKSGVTNPSAPSLTQPTTVCCR